MHISCAHFQHRDLFRCFVCGVWLHSLEFQARMGIFRGDAGSLVRAGWHMGMLGSGLIFSLLLVLLARA